jgi:hypothetical protein
MAGPRSIVFDLAWTGSAVDRIDVPITHEIGALPEDSTIEEIIPVGPTARKTEVHIRSSVVASSARALRSPAYLATIRRRESEKIAGQIAALAERSDSEDFEVWTHEPLQRLRRLIQQLSEAEEDCCPKHEGNSTEILRQLRDTFLKAGWQRYRDAQVRAVVGRILRNLAAADEVSAEDAFQAGDQLLDLDLDPAVGELPWDTPSDDEEEPKVHH